MRKILSVLTILMAQSIPLCHANILNNGTFDTPDNVWWANSGWQVGDPAAVKLLPPAGVAAEGWPPMAVDNQRNGMGFYQDVAATSGVTYTFTIWVREGDQLQRGLHRTKLEWKDSHGTDLGGTLITNISGQAGPTFTKFTISGSTINPACAYVRPVMYTQWLTPTNSQTATMQFDDASLEAEPAAVIMISQLPWIAFGIMLSAPIVGRKLRKPLRIHRTK